MSSILHSLFGRHEPTAESDAAALARLEKLSVLLDSAIRVPIIGTRIGADALLNFVPGAGLVLAKSLSAFIIWEAHRLGAPKRMIARMIGNLGVDFAISVVPLAGWVADAFYRANLRNVSMLKEHLKVRAGSHRASFARASGQQSPVIDGEWVRHPA